MVTGSHGEDPNPVIFDLPDPNSSTNYLFIEKIAFIPTK